MIRCDMHEIEDEKISIGVKRRLKRKANSR